MVTATVIFLLAIWTVTADTHSVSICVDLCPPCFPQRIATECSNVTLNCTHYVKAPGCGCCMVCASELGDKCGFHKPHCAPGLVCAGKNNMVSLTDLVTNNATCRPSIATASQTAARHSPRKRPAYSKVLARLKGHRRSRNRRPRHPHTGLLSPLNHDGPCSRHYEEMLTTCQTMPELVWLPNCHLGFYALQQCMTSTGSQPSKCWCADRNGEPMPGTPFTAEKPINCSRFRTK